MQAFMPRIEISLSKIRENTRVLTEFYGRKGITLMGVSKAVLGEPAIVEAMIQGGVKYIADSRIENLQRIKKAGVEAKLVLLRTPLSRTAAVVEEADFSLNSEIDTLEKLSYSAKAQNKNHKVIIMVEMGDLREGIMPQDLFPFLRKTLSFANIEVAGVGCNLACHGGVKPDAKNMRFLSELVAAAEKEFQINMEIVSGGNSANYDWCRTVQNAGMINNLRLGESILLGRETIDRNTIPGLHVNAFELVAEVIESKTKPSLPYGEICQDAFGNIPVFPDRGERERVIIALGRQDVLVSGLRSTGNFMILGSSSDHIILDTGNQKLIVGDEVKFSLNYGGLLAVMTSPFIRKHYVIGKNMRVGSQSARPNQ